MSLSENKKENKKEIMQEEFNQIVLSGGKYTINQLKHFTALHNRERDTNFVLRGNKCHMTEKYIKIINGDYENETNHFVYVIHSLNPSYPNRTYTGYSLDVPDIRQHNHNNRSCGAKYTKVGRPYELVFYLKGFKDETHALQFEKRCHHPNGWIVKKNGKIGKRGGRRVGGDLKGVARRIRILEYVMGLERCTAKAVLTRDYPLTIVVKKKDLKIKCKEPHKVIYE